MDSDNQINLFWNKFVRAELGFKGLDSGEWCVKANALFNPYFSDLSLEILGKEDDEIVSLVVTAHGRIDDFPLVMALVAAVPALQYHRVVAFRERMGEPEFSMGMDGFQLGTSEVLVSYAQDGGQVGLNLKFDREIPSDFLDHARHMAFIMLDHVLGEYDFAVKVGFVEFIANTEPDESEAALAWIPLSQFSVLFDRFWTEVLGRTGVFPSGEHDWLGLEIDSEEDGAIVTLNKSANSVAMRADLTYALTLSMEVISNAKQLKRVQNVQDQIATLLESDQCGILSHILLDAPHRHAVYYTGDVAKAEQMTRDLLQRAGLKQYELQSEFDPSWQKHFSYGVH